MRVEARYDTMGLIKELELVFAAASRLWKCFIQKLPDIDNDFLACREVYVKEAKLPLSDVAKNTMFVQPGFGKRHNSGEKRRC